jgi:hypothetical protein
MMRFVSGWHPNASGGARLLAGIVCLVLAFSGRAATFTVTSPNDVGAGTLYEALTNANALPDLDRIVFDISGAGPHTISPSAPLPTIVNPVIIDGYTQSGASSNTLSSGDNAVLKIRLSGSSAGGSADGLRINSAGCAVRGLAIINFSGHGVSLFSLSDTRIEGNFIGLDVDGVTVRSNSGAGIRSTASNATIGGIDPGARNIISANNGGGITLISSAANVVQGNFIGTDASGRLARGNRGAAITIRNPTSVGNVIGGVTPGARNVISASTGTGAGDHGIIITNCTGNVVQGNQIGTDVTGTNSLGNGASGVLLGAALSNVIGGVLPGEGNVIAFNGSAGVQLVSGTNALVGNSIFANSRLGIDLGATNVTANDVGDPDGGANNLQNFPVISAATNFGGALLVIGTLNSKPNSGYRLEFFSSPVCDSSGYGEGKNFLGAASVTTDPGGNASFEVQMPVVAPADAVVTATATAIGVLDMTSEFSACRSIVTAVIAPNIVAEPQAQLVEAGESAIFVVNAAGTPPLFYQWRRDGLAMLGATNATLIISNAQLTDTGAYTVIVSNSVGTATSSAANLTVVPRALTNMIAWWPGDGNAFDYAGSHHGALVNGATYLSGLVEGAFSLDGTNDFVDVGEAPELGGLHEITVMAWINKRDLANPLAGIVGRWDSYPLTKNNTFLLYNGDSSTTNKGAFALCFSDHSGGILRGNALLPTNQWVHVAATWRSSDGSTTLYKNGVPDAQGNLGQGKELKYAPGYSMKIGEWGVVRDASFKFSGRIDEAMIFSRALSAAAIASVYTAGNLGFAKGPVIVTPPANQIALTGTNVAFAVNVAGATPLSLQWLFNGSPIFGAGGATLLLSNLQPTHAGIYSVVVSNSFGATTSPPATLTVTLPSPGGLIGWWPGDGSALNWVGTNHGQLINGAAFGSGQVAQAFELDGTDDYVDIGDLTPLTNATEFTVVAWINKLGHTNGLAGFVGRWDSYPLTRTNSFLLYNGDGANTDRGALALCFSDHSGGVLAGQTVLPDLEWVHLVATWRSADGYTAIYKNGQLDKAGTLGVGKVLKYLPGYSAKIGEWGVVRGAAYKFGGLIDEVAVFQRALSAQEIKSLYFAAGAGMGKPPFIFTPPLSQTATAGTNLTLAVIAGGTAPLAYQWRFDGVAISDATNDTLTLTNLQPAQAGQYSVLVTNLYGAVLSPDAVLNVFVPVPPSLVSQPQSIDVPVGSNVVLAVTASGTGPLLYQWRLNGVNIADATNATLFLPDIQPTNSGRYTVVVHNEVGAAESAPAVVAVALPALPLQDDFNAMATVASAAGAGRGSNFAATAQSGEPQHAGKPGGKSMWIDWQAPVTGIATFSAAGSSLDTVLAVYTGNVLSNLTEVASDDDRGGYLTSTVRFNAVGGAHYKIAVDGFGGATGKIVLTWELEPTAETLPVILAHPISQTLGDGGSLTLVVNVADTNVNFQWLFDDNPIPGAVSNYLTLPSAGPANVGRYLVQLTRGLRVVKSRPAFVQLHLAPRLQNVRAFDKLRDAERAPEPLRLGDVGGPSPAPAAGLARAPAPAPGVSYGYSGTQVFSTYGSTKEPGEPNHCGVAGGASQWFTYAATTNGMLYVNTDGSSFDTVLAVYTGPGTSFSTLEAVACDNNSGLDGKDSALHFWAQRGVNYYIVVDGVKAATGTVRLNYSLVTPAELVPLGMINGCYRARVQGQSGMKFSVQRTPDFVQWTTVLTTNSASGSYDFADNNCAGFYCLYYRVVTMP